MLLLTDEASTATPAPLRKKASRRLAVVKAIASGRRGRPARQFTIKHSAKNAKKLTIADADGNVMGEVARCK